MSKIAIVYWSGTGNTQAMGAEVLEEGEFQPMFDSVEGKLGGKKIALFGSYGWGGGEWMQNWEKTCRTAEDEKITRRLPLQALLTGTGNSFKYKDCAADKSGAGLLGGLAGPSGTCEVRRKILHGWRCGASAAQPDGCNRPCCFPSEWDNRSNFFQGRI